ncbi:hypothetical protein BS78_03G355200 [Paspalum vaginatum]|nr:hypothetical protein BS78_03G355200 [Paspalum vaginatum]
MVMVIANRSIMHALLFLLLFFRSTIMRSIQLQLGRSEGSAAA